MSQYTSTRRVFLRSTGAAATVCLLGSSARGANERINIAFIGVGNRGKQLLPFALKQPEMQVVAVCDVKDEARQKAAALATAEGHQPRQVKDFRDVLADRSIDVVCIATPDHWHAYMTVEACKAGKDVYVEKPLCAGVNEGLAMVRLLGGLIFEMAISDSSGRKVSHSAKRPAGRRKTKGFRRGRKPETGCFTSVRGTTSIWTDVGSYGDEAVATANEQIICLSVPRPRRCSRSGRHGWLPDAPHQHTRCWAGPRRRSC